MTSPILGTTLEQARRDLTSVKWTAFTDDVLPVWVAEMDASPCPAVVEAVSAAVRRGDTGYDMGRTFASALAGFAADAWGWQIPEGSTMSVADVMIGIEALIRQVTDPQGAVVLSPPVYDSFYGFVTTTGRRLVEAPLSPEGRLDLSILDEAFATARGGGRSAAYLLCNPQNPTGTVHTPKELTALAALAASHGVTVISDEIHAPLVYAGSAFTPYLTVPGGEDGFSVWSASKAWNLAGFKAAQICAGAAAVPTLRRIHDVHTHGVGHVGAIAQAAALTDGRGWLARLLGELDANRTLLRQLLADRLPGIEVQIPAATYLAWLDCRALGLGADPAKVFLDRGRVALSSGPNYGPTAGLGFARFNFAASPAIIEQAVDRMVTAVERTG